MGGLWFPKSASIDQSTHTAWLSSCCLCFAICGHGHVKFEPCNNLYCNNEMCLPKHDISSRFAKKMRPWKLSSFFKQKTCFRFLDAGFLHQWSMLSLDVDYVDLRRLQEANVELMGLSWTCQLICVEMIAPPKLHVELILKGGYNVPFSGACWPS